jgi:hypothetical protein
MLSPRAKEGRYWAWEFPIALLTIFGTLVLGIGLPVIIMRSTAWASLFIGLGEGLGAIALFYFVRLNVMRATAAAMFLAGAAIFIASLNKLY